MTQTLLSKYSDAEVRIATTKINNKPRLLFATVQLLPPNSHKSYTGDLIKFKNKGDTVYFRKVVMTASEAINWYQTNELLPLPKPKEGSTLFDYDIDKKPKDSIEINLTNETSWENEDFIIPLKENNMISFINGNDFPFLGYSKDRLHRRFGYQDDLKLLIKNEKINLFLKNSLYVDLSKYHEYLGGMILILPNPFIESIECTLLNPNSDEEKNLFKFNPYSFSDLASLKLIYFEVYLGNLKNLKIHDIPESGILILPHRNPKQKIGYFLYHEQFGCLTFNPPNSYLRKMNLNLHVVENDVRVETRENNKNSSKSFGYNVQRLTHGSGQIFGNITNIEIFDRVANAINERHLIHKKIESGQVWFNKNNREEALETLHNIIKEAKKRVIFFDPYFGELQISQYALIPAINKIETQIVTSRLAFKNDKKEIVKNAEKFAEQLKNYESQLNDKLTITCFVLDQKHPMLHDRFLIIDDNVWFIGHSFNQIGTTNAFMLKIPAPNDVLKELNNIKSNTITLDEFIKKYSE